MSVQSIELERTKITRACSCPAYKILAETIFDTHGRLRILPLLKDGLAADHATGATFEATRIIEALAAIVLDLIKSCRTTQHELAEFLVRRILFQNDMGVLLVNIELIDRELIVDIDGDITNVLYHSALIPFMASLAIFMMPTFFTGPIAIFFML